MAATLLPVTSSPARYAPRSAASTTTTASPASNNNAADTRLRRWVDHQTGMWCLRGEFDPETGAQLDAQLRATVEPCSTTPNPTPAPRPPRQTRPPRRPRSRRLDRRPTQTGLRADRHVRAHRRRNPPPRPTRPHRHRLRPGGRSPRGNNAALGLLADITPSSPRRRHPPLHGPRLTPRRPRTTTSATRDVPMLAIPGCRVGSTTAPSTT